MSMLALSGVEHRCSASASSRIPLLTAAAASTASFPQASSVHITAAESTASHDSAAARRQNGWRRQRIFDTSGCSPVTAARRRAINTASYESVSIAR